MNDTLQDIRGKVQELLSRAEIDASFRQMLQVNPGDVLCTAGIPKAIDSTQLALPPTCEVVSCMLTCFTTS